MTAYEAFLHGRHSKSPRTHSRLYLLLEKYGTRWLKLFKLHFNMATKFDYKIYRRE